MARKVWAANRERLRLLELHRPAELVEALLGVQPVAAEELLWLAGKAWNAGAELGAGRNGRDLRRFARGRAGWTSPTAG